jgi:Flp pilus assembly secretin CpaC
MKQSLRAFAILVCVLSLSRVAAYGQAASPLLQSVVQLQVTVSRYMGANKVSSQPYLLSLVPGESGSIKVGVEVPVPAAWTNPNRPDNAPATTVANPQPSYTMQQVGTQVDGNATLLPDGQRYKLRLTVTERSVLPAAQATEQGARVANVPSFRNVVLSSTIFLKDGQSTQFSSATDKVSGETFKVEVLLTVEK